MVLMPVPMLSMNSLKVSSFRGRNRTKATIRAQKLPSTREAEELLAPMASWKVRPFFPVSTGVQHGQDGEYDQGTDGDQQVPDRPLAGDGGFFFLEFFIDGAQFTGGLRFVFRVRHGGRIPGR